MGICAQLQGFEMGFGVGSARLNFAVRFGIERWGFWQLDSRVGFYEGDG